MRRLLALLDPLFGGSPLITETHYRPARQAQVRHDKTNSWKQLSAVELHLHHNSSCGLPTGRLVEKTLVPDHWLVARPPHGPRQQLRNVPLQAIVGWNANRIRHTALHQRFVDLRFGKGRVRPESNFLALRLLTLDFR